MTTKEVCDSPTAWFVLLERAWRTGDVALELKALDELRRLGVRVTFTGDQFSEAIAK